jgi:hypothetical protein
VTVNDAPKPPDLVPGDAPQPSNRPIDEEVVSEPLEDDDGTEVVVAQENVGEEEELGGGEWPDPDTPPRGPTPG